MEVIIYLLIFIMGTFFGSFFTLAVYRIPLKQDIIYTHSYCPNCKHKLNIIDLFPIFSYIALKGKCRYCGEKIRIRYLLLEVLSGLVFVLYAISFKFDINYLFLQKYKLIFFGFGILYMASLFIMAGIDKEKRNINNSLLIYNLAISTFYIIYVCTTIKKIVYSYIICLIIMLILIIINKIIIHKSKPSNYFIQIIALSSFILIFSGIKTYLISVVLTLLAMFVIYFINKIKKIKLNDKSIGFYMCLFNIILIVLMNFIRFYTK